MLILSRRRDEVINAGLVTFTVVDIRGDRVRLGIEAPKTMPIHRREVLQAIAAEDPVELIRLGYELNDQGLAVPRRDLVKIYDIADGLSLDFGHKAA